MLVKENELKRVEEFDRNRQFLKSKTKEIEIFEKEVNKKKDIIQDLTEQIKLKSIAMLELYQYWFHMWCCFYIWLIFVTDILNLHIRCSQSKKFGTISWRIFLNGASSLLKALGYKKWLALRTSPTKQRSLVQAMFNRSSTEDSDNRIKVKNTDMQTFSCRGLNRFKFIALCLNQVMGLRSITSTRRSDWKNSLSLLSWRQKIC